jgi:serine/threonine-protein kinase
MYDEALALAERAGDQAAAALARQGRADMTPRLGFLVVNVPEAAAAASGLEITRDQERLPKAAWGTSIPVNPGDHVVSAHAPGYRDWSTTRTAGGEGTTTTVDVPVLVREQSGADERVGDGRARGLGTQRVIALVSGGLGIVGVAVGTYFGLAAMSQKSDYRAHVGADGQCADTTCESSSHDAFSSGTSSTIAFIAGGVLLATGAVLWLTAPKSGSIRVAPVAASRTAGLALEGGF